MNNAADVLKYFPDYKNKIYPNKKFMLNILNTIDPGLVISTIKDMKDKREKHIKENPIAIT